MFYILGNIKIVKIVFTSWVKANEIAVPTNEAEQGVASITANIPERKLVIISIHRCHGTYTG